MRSLSNSAFFKQYTSLLTIRIRTILLTAMDYHCLVSNWKFLYAMLPERRMREMLNLISVVDLASFIYLRPAKYPKVTFVSSIKDFIIFERYFLGSFILTTFDLLFSIYTPRLLLLCSLGHLPPRVIVVYLFVQIWSCLSVINLLRCYRGLCSI